MNKCSGLKWGEVDWSAAERVSVRLAAECSTVASSSVVALACLGQERAENVAVSPSAGVAVAVTEAAGGVTMMLLQSLNYPRALLLLFLPANRICHHPNYGQLFQAK